MTIEIKLTSRGFQIGKFKDANGDECSIQQSSAILSVDGFDRPGSTALWLGRESEHVHSVTGERIGARMHLSRELAEELRSLLGLWLETGALVKES